MKRILLFACALILLAPAAFAGGKKKNKEKEAAMAVAENNNEVHWMTLDEAQAAMKKQPKKVWMDVYTSWCGWCKVMDKKTFTNPDVIKYLNQHFYAVKLDAEQKDSISFMGKKYGFVPEERANHFAVEIMRGQMSYPTSVYMEEGFQSPMCIPGYQEVPAMEMILKYLAEGIYKKTPFPEYQEKFVGTWK